MAKVLHAALRFGWLIGAVLALQVVALPPGDAQAATPSNQATLVARVAELTNAERLKAGVPALTVDAALGRAAQKYAELLSAGGCFSHTCGGTTAGQRISAEGYLWRTWGENIAAGYSTPEAVVAAWMGSSGHRANILNPNFKNLGVGVATGPGVYRIYWVQDFAARR